VLIQIHHDASEWVSNDKRRRVQRWGSSWMVANSEAIVEQNFVPDR